MAPRVRVHWRAIFGPPQLFLWLPALVLFLGALPLMLGVRPPGWTEAARLALGDSGVFASVTLATDAAIVARVRQHPVASGRLRAVLAAAIPLTVVALILNGMGAAETAASPSEATSLYTVGAAFFNLLLIACNGVVIDAVPRLRDPEPGGAA